ncbi:hypothetical protein [Alteromonas oceanisediminis]|uniref:hypothetical protein n=1 Tax=Alteromonas oceanisediminis TaxID=2836180 RepID=UPI001BDB5804|nr:hypothetical protein [Alteromonas oceanisediminis]MBT0585600.1 hypothetical protein [Alteromonas oceanisediminis]
MSDTHFNSYFITDTVETATDVIDQLKSLGIPENDIGVVSKDKDIAKADLPEADLTEKSQLPEALKRGAMLGSGSGLFAGVLMATFPVVGFTVGGAAILGMTAGGAAAGAWSASMIGVSENSELVEQFEQALDDDKTLIFCELDASQREQVAKRFSSVKSGTIE